MAGEIDQVIEGDRDVNRHNVAGVGRRLHGQKLAAESQVERKVFGIGRVQIELDRLIGVIHGAGIRRD